MIKNLGGNWNVGQNLLAKFEASVPQNCPDFSIRWGSGKLGGTTLVFDLGWFKRSWNEYKENKDGYYQIGLNHIGWLSECSDPSRWEALGLDVLQPKEGGRNNVLAIGQVELDSQHGLNKIELRDWIDHKASQYSKSYRYRPHPQGSEGMPQNALQEDLDWADIVVTYNSTVGLEALRQGIPVISSSNCFYRDLCGEECPAFYQRYEFFCRLAWSQWTQSEIADGTAYNFYQIYL